MEKDEIVALLDSLSDIEYVKLVNQYLEVDNPSLVIYRNTREEVNHLFEGYDAWAVINMTGKNSMMYSPKDKWFQFDDRLVSSDNPKDFDEYYMDMLDDIALAYLAGGLPEGLQEEMTRLIASKQTT